MLWAGNFVICPMVICISWRAPPLDDEKCRNGKSRTLIWRQVKVNADKPEAQLICSELIFCLGMVNNSTLRNIIIFDEVNIQNDSTVYFLCFSLRTHDHHTIKDEIVCASCQSRSAFISFNNSKQFSPSAYNLREQLFILCYLVSYLAAA